MALFPAYGSLPGIGTLTEETPKRIWWGRQEQLLYTSNNFIDSTAVDAGNTPTTTIRAGMLMGRQTSDSNLYAFNHDATDGTERIVGVTMEEVNMLDATGTAEDKGGVPVLLRAPVVVGDLLIEGTAFTSSAAEFEARKQLARLGFILDDELTNRGAYLGAPINVKQVITDTTVVEADNGTLFVAITADATFTLPAIHPGLAFEFLRASDHEMVVVSAAGDDMIVGNDLSADSVTFTTDGQSIGAYVRVVGIHIGGTAKWLVHLPNMPFGTGLTGGFAYSIATA